MSTSIVMTVLASLTLGGALGAAVTHQLTATVQVACQEPVRVLSPAARNFFSGGTPLPFTGQKY